MRTTRRGGLAASPSTSWTGSPATSSARTSAPTPWRLGSPRAIYERAEALHGLLARFFRVRVTELHRARAVFRVELLPGYSMPKWQCEWLRVALERYPTNWGLPRAVIHESQCAARGAPACVWAIRWKNPTVGHRFWRSVLAGALGSGVAGLAWWAGQLGSALAGALVTAMPVVAGAGLGLAWQERALRRETQRLRDLQSEEILHSNQELAEKFRDLETKIEQLSFLSDLSAAVNATLETEKIYEQALHRLVHRMGFNGANLMLMDAERGILRAHRHAGDHVAPAGSAAVELPLAGDASVNARVARTGLPVIVNDVDDTTEPVHLPTVRARGIRAFVAVPLRVKDRSFGVLECGGRRARAVHRVRRRAPHRRGQPRRPRRGPRGELPDHRGPHPWPRGQGARADRAAPQRQRGAGGGLPELTGHADAARAAREDGLGGPARRRRRPRAEQPDRLRLLQRRHAGGLRHAPARHARRLSRRGPPRRRGRARPGTVGRAQGRLRAASISTP